MSIKFEAIAPVKIVPTYLTKFRENSKDSIVYIAQSHTVERPRLVTITSELPTPRKGNAGTMKTTVNSRWTVNIAADGEPENNVPVIAKLQTSFPVGTPVYEMQNATHVLTSMLGMADEEYTKLFQTGILPSD
uniref:Uncharacterized protein n=1 Tax=Wenzhou levi-like virus 5 TaxID=1923571 RepID=A0A1L3KIR6_9VIRU|nr:hypothetical protein [Wenzhou levi-like virus 5]